MELSWLEDFLALANSANFSRAADLRNMTQPALSRRIKALEDWLGAPLFDRTHQPVALTDAGRLFLPVADDALRRLFQARDECREAEGHRKVVLRFAATHSLSLTFFPAWLRSLEEAGPLGAVRLISDSLQSCEQIMLAGQAQFLLCHHVDGTSGRLVDGRFVSRRVGEDRLLAVSAPGPDGNARHPIGPESAPVPYLAYNTESGLGRILAARQHQIALQPVFTSHLAAVLRALAIEGRGVAWLPLGLIAQDLERGTLVRSVGERQDIPLEIRLFRPQTRLAPGAEKFWESLEK